MRVVVVEDEHLLRRRLTAELAALGFEVFEASDPYACRVVLAREKPDVVLLDLGLPGMSGLAFIEELRREPGLAVIVVSRTSNPETLIEALDLGCDDFVVKPVHAGELAARIRSVLRRRQARTHEGARVGPWRVDLDARTAISEHGQAMLTRGEFEILRLLLRAGGKIVSRSELIRVVSATPDAADLRTVDALVSRLRRKLALPEGGAALIQTAPGLGYRLIDEAEPVAAPEA